MKKINNLIRYSLRTKTSTYKSFCMGLACILQILLFVKSFPQLCEYPITYSLGLVIGWLLSDLFTGIYHFLLDTFDFKAIPPLNKRTVEYRIHHTNLDNVFRIDYIYMNYPPLMLSNVVLIPIYLLNNWNMSPFLISCLLSSLFFIGWSQMCHKFCHKKLDKTKLGDRILHYLQKSRIILGQKTHMDVHHESPDPDKGYGSVSGWGDYILNPITSRIIKWLRSR